MVREGRRDDDDEPRGKESGQWYGFFYPVRGLSAIAM